MPDMREYVQEMRSGDALALHLCGWEQCAAGHSFGPAVRSHFLFHFVLSGKGVFEHAGRRFELTAGQGFLIVPGESTRYTADEHDPWQYCWIGFDGTEAERILQDCSLSGQSPIYTDHSGLLGQELLRLIDLFDRESTNTYRQLGQLYLCFAHMAGGASQASSTPQEHVERAISFMQSNFSYEIGVAEVARAVGIERSYLYRIFRRWQGCSPKEYLMQVRLQNAAKMLRSTQLSVTEIALSCGFREASLFGKQFKAAFGISPLKYRVAAPQAIRDKSVGENRS